MDRAQDGQTGQLKPLQTPNSCHTLNYGSFSPPGPSFVFIHLGHWFSLNLFRKLPSPGLAEATCIAGRKGGGPQKAAGGYWSPEMLAGQEPPIGGSFTFLAKGRLSSLGLGRAVATAALVQSSNLQWSVEDSLCSWDHRIEKIRTLPSRRFCKQAKKPAVVRCETWKQAMEGMGTGTERVSQSVMA